jgi:hypothetical protein
MNRPSRARNTPPLARARSTRPRPTCSLRAAAPVALFASRALQQAAALAFVVISAASFGLNAQAPAAPAAPAVDAAPAPEETPAQRYRRGRAQFDYGDCAGASTTLSDLAVPGRLQDESQQIEVHRMLGVCAALAGKELEAAREFSSLLAIDPDYLLDTFLTPPPVVEIFDRQKRAMRVQLDEIRRAKEREREAYGDAEGGVLVERVITVEEKPFIAAFLPLGLAQLVNDEPTKALIFGSVQGTLLAVNIAGFWTSVGIKSTTVDTDEKLLAQNIAWFVHVGALSLFALTYGYGVADAMWNREDQRVKSQKQTRRPLTEDEIKKLREVPRAPPPGAAPALPSDGASDGAPANDPSEP